MRDVTKPRPFKEVIFKMAMSLVNIIRKGKVSGIISGFVVIFRLSAHVDTQLEPTASLCFF